MTIDLKHAPGPLAVAPNPAADAGGDPKYLIRTPDGWPVGLAWQPADAALFAAAPDLLAALVELIHRHERRVNNGLGSFDECHADAARAAVAKATGEGE